VRRAALLIAGALLFGALATANAGGYRYGVSDQAYYLAAAARAADPSLFPRDAPLLNAQSRHMLVDDIVGGLVRITGIGLPAVSFVLYLLALATLFAAVLAFTRALGLSWWATTGLLLLLTLRHRIPKTGANTLEGYMHPRMLAFALGVAALACVVRRRFGVALVWIAIAAVAHTTTALWFGLAMGAAAFVVAPAWRRNLSAAAAIGAILAAWATSMGPLAGRLHVMDDAWLEVLAGKDYLFAVSWPLYAWVLNLGYLAILLTILRRRARLGTVRDGETGLVGAMFVLALIFLVSVPLAASHLALAVQLQVNRVFWIMDFLAAAAVAWWLIDDWAARAGTRGRVVVIAALAALSLGRGIFVTAVEAGRPPIQIGLPDTAWTDAMRWLSRQPADWHVLADPGHAWKYGSSVRVAAGRDTLLELEKDSALAMYDRDIAIRVADRAAALADFDLMTTDTVRALDTRYALDVFVTENGRSFGFPILYRNNRFVIYDLR
jgi:hypothetical protein